MYSDFNDIIINFMVSREFMAYLSCKRTFYNIGCEAPRSPAVNGLGISVK